MGAKTILRVAIIMAMLAGAGPALAQPSASVETRATLTVVDPPALGLDAALTVGPVVRPAGASGLTARAVEGRYEVSGIAGDSYNIAMPRTLRLVRTGGAEEVVLQLTPEGVVSSLPGAYGARSSGSLSVQGAVGVPADAAPGLYKGAFPVILSLQ